jgi:hypothetical protein
MRDVNRDAARRVALASCGCSLAAFLVASFLPIWISWSFSDWEGVGSWETYWTALIRILRGNPHVGTWDLVEHHHRSNWVQAFLILAAGFVVGRFGSWWYWFRQSRAR